MFSPSQAEKLGLVELSPGTNVYLPPEYYRLAHTKCSLPPKGTWVRDLSEVRVKDGRPAARFLMGVFFTDEELSVCTLSHKSNLPTLDPTIVKAIQDFCVRNSASSLPEINTAISCKLTGYRSRRRKKVTQFETETNRTSEEETSVTLLE